MKENKYDDLRFFDRYSRMPRSVEGLKGAGEWHVLQKISSLAFHYLESFEDIAEKVRRCLVLGGNFVFSVEHPVFTAPDRMLFGTIPGMKDELRRPMMLIVAAVAK